MALIIKSAEKSLSLGTGGSKLSSGISSTQAKMWLGTGGTVALSSLTTICATQASPESSDYALEAQWHEEQLRQAGNFYNTALLIALVVSVIALAVIAICFRKWRHELALLKRLESELPPTKSTTS